MKNDIINKINENRAAFDNDTPDSIAWENIHKELHPSQKKNLFPWLKVAAVFAVLLGTVWYFIGSKIGKNDKLVSMVDSTKDYFYQVDSTRVEVNDPALRNKVIRGGSWKDMDAYLQSSSRTYDGKDFKPFRGNVFKSNGTSTVVTLSDANGSNGAVACYNSTTAAGTYAFTDNNTSANSTHMWSFGDDGVEEPTLGPGHYYEQYDEFNENKFIKTMSEAVSTFGIDVDKAGYSNIRRFINGGFLPPKNAVKLEEMVNYFDYNLAEPTGIHPFAITSELGKCPWNTQHQLLQVCIKGKNMAEENYPANNLVFLIDVSGSMEDQNKLPLLKQGLKLLVEKMRAQDKVSIVVYAGAAGLVLQPTSGNKKDVILEALNNLQAGGSTAGGEGINLAYKIAEKSFIKNGNNRIILATDGDFNVGVYEDKELIKLVEKKRKGGVCISVLGFGEGNLQSSRMEKIADNGNGNYSYIDNILEAKKVLITEMGGTLHTIAKDVKLQLEFNPKIVESYRLLGYENRMLATEDFDNDIKDAGDLGSGHTVIALYEITPTTNKNQVVSNNLKYQTKYLASNPELVKELVTIKFRYKEPTASKSKLLSVAIKNTESARLSNNFLFASAVAEFGLLIRKSEYKAQANFDNVIKRAKLSKGRDENGYRAEFIKLCELGQLIYNEYHSSKILN